jgi:general stress protein YciG
LKKDSKWYKAYLKKYGSDEAISEAMRERQKKSRENYSGTGGFVYLKKHDPQKLQEITSKGGSTPKRYGKEEDRKAEGQR